ncbi:MAG: NAD(P)-dependent oxidoreductase [Candidatus Rokubacteria bacterium]|nr:NAD(P)-dependent oxidoreductase [Candidatus Rokubacteria bacterium]
MTNVTMGILHPGEMGSAIGAAARVAGALVLWASEGRSASTRKRAEEDGLADVRTVERLVTESQVILSVCPPANAVDVAREVAAEGFGGLYVDGNAVSPDTTREVGSIVTAGGARFIDGGIIGPPPRRPGVCRLYLSGDGADEVAALLTGGLLEPIPIAGPVGAASAVKMAYAGWNKGSQALLMAVRALAMHEGVDEVLLAEWARSQPELPARSEAAVKGTARKAWRFVGEMEEIAATFDAAGLPDGFHRASADVYARLANWKDTPAPPSVAEVTKELTRNPR